MRLIAACCLAAALSLATPAAAADWRPQAGDPVVVNLLNGGTVRGVLLRDEGLLTLRMPDGSERQINVDRYSSVRRDEAAPAPLAPTPAPATAAAPPAPGDQVVVTLMSGEAVRGTLQEQSQGGLTLTLADGATRRLNYDAFREVHRLDGAAAPAAPAAPRGEPYRTRVGLGASIPGPGDLPTFYVPIQVSPTFRLEPELGLASASGGGESATSLQLGVGLLGTWSVAPQVGGYAGLRAQLQRFEATGGERLTNVRMAGVLGGEWYPVPAVSLGVEAQLAWVSLDKSATGNSRTATGVSTGALLFLRVYLR